jgi:uncharacterized membrane protein YfcA
VDVRAAAWLVGPGLVGAALGAWMTEWVETSLLLLATAVLLAYQAIRILQRPRGTAKEPTTASPAAIGAIGATAGLVSGLLGVGGGIVIVPLLAGWLGMPLKRALGTSLLAIVALVVPGTVVHAALGHVDAGIFVALVLGAVPGARIGAGIALDARERTLSVAVGAFLLAIALAYALAQLSALRDG